MITHVYKSVPDVHCLAIWKKSMELGLSLGASHVYGQAGRSMVGHGALGEEETGSEDRGSSHGEEEVAKATAHACTPLQLELLPPGPVPRFSGRSDNDVCASRNQDVNRLAQGEEAADNGGGVVSPPKSTSSATVGMGLSICTRLTTGRKRERHQTASNELEIPERPASRASDEEENVIVRKKLRLSKEQSAFLEESFKQHSTLNPKQKQALAKQLNLRPRQVEVWFQNRRARTKLKQTEVDCEYLKRCFEVLTEENRRLQKELQEVRALKTASPYSSQVPATTLTMCPSCERMSTTSKTGVLHAIQRSFAS